MIKILSFVLILTISTVSGNELCKEIPEISANCFKERESGIVKNCSKRYKDKFKNRACEVGCLSETLYEANMFGEEIKKECQQFYNSY
ncbi:hypothetical protein [Persephonella sp.]